MPELKNNTSTVLVISALRKTVEAQGSVEVTAEQADHEQVKEAVEKGWASLDSGTSKSTAKSASSSKPAAKSTAKSEDTSKTSTKTSTKSEDTSKTSAKSEDTSKTTTKSDNNS